MRSPPARRWRRAREAFLISPGPCTPTEAGISLDLVAACADAGRPLLGVCLGHQAIGQHFGGRVERGGLMHGKTSPVVHDGTGVFAGLPSPFTATRYHSLIVNDVPDALVVNARTDDGIVMGFRHATLPIHGVQFHPESIATEHGHALLANFLRIAGIARVARTRGMTDARAAARSRRRRCRAKARRRRSPTSSTAAPAKTAIADFLIGLSDRGETAIEIAEAARALRERLIPIDAPAGRDRRLRHRRRRPPHAQRLDRGRAGRRGVRRARSPSTATAPPRRKAGAADTLEALGLDMDRAGATAEASLPDLGIAFLFAANHHPAMRADHPDPPARSAGARSST